MKDGNEDGRWDHIVPLLGAFHLFMEAFKKSNDFNEEGIAWLVSTFIGKNGNEATEQNIAYFLDFKDPTDYEKMMGSILHAIYDHAIRSMQESGIEEANPKMVLDFMRKRAKESPLANSILILVWLWEVTLLIRKSERNNSFETFLSGLRLFLPICCDTNATEYTRIISGLLKYWAIASEVEKKTLELYGFTLDTGNGVHVGIDFVHEKYVNLIRLKTGKIVKRGHAAMIEHVGINVINDATEKDIKTPIQFLRNNGYLHNEKKRNKRFALDSRIYTKVTLALEDRGIFKCQSTNQEKFERSTTRLYSPRFEGIVLNADLLRPISIGYKRRDKYIKRYCIDTEMEVSWRLFR